MLRFLLTPKWLALTLVCVMVLPAFKALSDWQWRRLHQRQQWNTLITSNQAKPPAQLADLRGTIAIADQWRSLRACGTWVTAQQVLVRKRSFEAHQGFWVATPLHTEEGDIVIVRGWVGAGESSTDSPAIPVPPSGTVCTESRLRLTTDREQPRPKDVPQGQVDSLVPGEIDTLALAGAYGELTWSSPESSGGLRMLPAPEISEGPHRSYALQWLFFMLMTVVGWVILVREEVQRRSSEN